MAFGDDHPFQCNLKCFQPKSACNAGDTGDVGLIPGSVRSPGEGNGNLLQYSCLGNPMNRKPGRLQFMESQKSWAQLSNQNKNFMGKRDKEMSSFGTL